MKSDARNSSIVRSDELVDEDSSQYLGSLEGQQWRIRFSDLNIGDEEPQSRHLSSTINDLTLNYCGHRCFIAAKQPQPINSPSSCLSRYFHSFSS